jgi:Transposase DDE domain group 1
VMKSDLAGGQLPSGLFGANAAWWTLMILALNLNTTMKRLVIGKDWVTKRMKALRFRLIGLPGRVVNHTRKLIIRLGAGTEALATFISARQTIRGLACGPVG